MRNAFIDRIMEECDRRDDIFILSGDAGLGVFDTFKDKHPGRFLNMGVAEQNTISFAAGLAMTGFRVVVYNIAPFVLYRCYEQVRNDICYQELPVVLVGTGSGVTYAPMGMSHYAVEDLGVSRTLPNLTVISPMDPVEAKAAADFVLGCDKPAYIRLAKRGEPVFHTGDISTIASPLVVREGEGTAIVFHGTIAQEVMAAYAELTVKGHFPMLVSVPTVQPLDTAALRPLLAEMNHVICVEEHFVNCGLGSVLAQEKAERPTGWGLTVMGIPPHFIHDIGTSAELRSLSGISAADIVRVVMSVSGEK